MHVLLRYRPLLLITAVLAACGRDVTTPSDVPSEPSTRDVTIASPTGRVLGITPSSRDFGSVAAGGSAAQVFVVTNLGNRATSALGVSLVADAPFSVTADGCSGLSLGKGRTCSVTVRFAPTAEGSYSGSLTVSSRTPAGATITAQLTGSSPDVTSPSVTIDQAGGQADPTGASPIVFTVVFSETVTGFGPTGVSLAGTAGATTASVAGGGTTYTVSVSGMTASGTVVASILAGAATDAGGNPNTASASTDNTVNYEYTPTVTEVEADLQLTGSTVTATCTARGAGGAAVPGAPMNLEVSSPDFSLTSNGVTNASGVLTDSFVPVEGETYTLRCTSGAASDLGFLSYIGS